MSLKCGIVGLPNVGKSTLFNALTRAHTAEAANYPFCTIEPNVGMVGVPDPRLAKLADIVKPQKIIGAAIEFVDIAGLVAGAAQGEGLGNKFLSHIREVDAIAHVVRAFEDNAITHVNDAADPAADIDTINTELLLADLETADKALQRASNKSKDGDKKAVQSRDLFAAVKTHIEGGNAVRSFEVDAQLQAQIAQACFLTAKPVLYVANVDENGAVDNPALEKIKTIAAVDNAQVTAICAAVEAELSTLDEADALQLLGELGWTESGLSRVIRAAYSLLGLQTFFTAGEKEVRAWTVRNGIRAPAAAGTIHGDFEKGFIRAETIAFADYIAHNGAQGAKEAGKLRLEGKDYAVQDGDVLHFRFNV